MATVAPVTMEVLIRTKGSKDAPVVVGEITVDISTLKPVPRVEPVPPLPSPDPQEEA